MLACCFSFEKEALKDFIFDSKVSRLATSQYFFKSAGRFCRCFPYFLCMKPALINKTSQLVLCILLTNMLANLGENNVTSKNWKPMRWYLLRFNSLFGLFQLRHVGIPQLNSFCSGECSDYQLTLFLYLRRFLNDFIIIGMYKTVGSHFLTLSTDDDRLQIGAQFLQLRRNNKIWNDSSNSFILKFHNHHCTYLIRHPPGFVVFLLLFVQLLSF